MQRVTKACRANSRLPELVGLQVFDSFDPATGAATVPCRLRLIRMTTKTTTAISTATRTTFERMPA